jgi:hypothetical protein
MFAHAHSLSFAVVLTAASLFGLAGEADAMQCAKHDSMATAPVPLLVCAPVGFAHQTTTARTISRTRWSSVPLCVNLCAI